MAVTPYCTSDDIETILSEFGLSVRLDDDENGCPDTGMATACIERGAVQINHYLLARYSVADCVSSGWVKWVNAIFAAREACARRMMPPPESLVAQCNEFMEELRFIRAGTHPLMGDDGPLATRFDGLPTVSNMVVDGRYAVQKIRRKPQTSTGGPPPGGRKQLNTRDFTGDAGIFQ